MQIGLYLLVEKRVWRLVSEDTGEHRSFLLIVRTFRFSLPLARRVLKDARSFQQIAKFIYVTTTFSPNQPCSSNCYHHLPIVTAAVYRGFDQELRLAADPIN